MGILDRFRRESEEPVEALPLALSGPDGDVWLEFPGEVVAAVRQSINRIMRTDPFPERLALTSAVRQEGVTYLSRAMGVVLANDFGRKCCVVELNWWWPADYPEAISGKVGTAEILSEKSTLEEALIPTGIENLSLLTAGKMVSNLRPTFAGSEGVTTLMDSIHDQFDHVILDIPAVTATSDAILLAAHGEKLCFVIQQGATPVQRVRAALDDLDHLELAGVIMNQMSVATPRFLLDYIAQE